MNRKIRISLVGLAFFALGFQVLLGGCTGDEDDCATNETAQCTCEDGNTGAKTCKPDGSDFGDCLCTTSSTDIDEQTAAGVVCPVIKTTIKVPDDYPGNPIRIGGWFYAVDQWPPAGPPQGGWDVYPEPDIAPDKPYLLIEHSENLSRNGCLKGPHVITVALTQSEPIVGRRPNMGVDYTGLSETVMLGDGGVDAGVVMMRLLTDTDML